MGAYEEGMELRERRRLKAAVTAFEQAVEENPASAPSWFWLAATRDNRGQEAEAIPAYERALSLGLAPDEEAKAWTWLASSYSKTGRHGDAIEAISRAQDLGGYEPQEEFVKIAHAVHRRSGLPPPPQ